MVELTQEEKQLLTEIVNDKFSVGAFSGMIYNSYISKGGDFDALIKDALSIRLRMKQLVK